MAAEFQIVNWNFISFLGFAIAVASFGTMLWIAGKQTKQTADLAVVTEDIEKMLSDQKQLTDDLRDVYASTIVEYVQRISNLYGLVIDFYKNQYKNGLIYLDKNKDRKTLDDFYDQHLFDLPRIEPIELVKAFGTEITNKHWRLTAKLRANMWQTYSDHGMALLMNSYREQMAKLVELKDVFVPYCNQRTKNDEAKYQKNYDLIKKENKEKVSIRSEDFTDTFTVQDSFNADLSDRTQKEEKST
jgi:hypothetical protein